MATDEEPTVLVVEDNEELADRYAKWLRERYAARTAYTGGEALERADETVDVVLLDRRLPDMTGSDVLDGFEARGLDPRVAVITAVDPDVDILEMRFDDYVLKPVLKADLHAIVERLRHLSAYDDQFRESFELATKLRALETERPAEELEASEAYQAAADRLVELRGGLEDTFERFEATDFETVYRELTDDDG